MPGTITFKPIEANLTHNTSRLLGMDPYCLFTIGDNSQESQVAPRGGKHPHWDDSVTLDATLERCKVEIKDKLTLLPDENIGSFEIDLHEVQTKGNVKKWYPISFAGHSAGEILIEATFSPENKIDLNIAPSVAGESASDLSGSHEKDLLKRTQSEQLEHHGITGIPVTELEKAKSTVDYIDKTKDSGLFEQPEEKEYLEPDQKDLFHAHHKDRDGLDLTSEIGPHRSGYDKNLWSLPTDLKELKDVK